MPCTTLSVSAAATIGPETTTVLVTAGAASFALTLPDAAKKDAGHLWVKRTDPGAGVVTLAAAAGQTVEGVASVVIAPQSCVQLVVDPAGTGWWILSSIGSLGNVPAAMSTSANALVASAAADTTTNSTSDVLMDSMTLTPTATGLYCVVASTSVRNATVLASITMSIYNNGVRIDESQRPVISTTQTLTLLNAAPCDVALSTFAVLSATAGQAIDVRWRTSSGTATAHQRSIALFRLPS